MALCATAAVLLLPHVYLIAVHLRRGRHEVARERQRLESLTSALRAAPKPVVCVQLPVHNEAHHIEAAIDCLCALEWPRDRLEVQVLDDSTDETSGIAAARVVRWRAEGMRISHIRRDARTAFKAGALQDGLAQTNAEYIAVFDADYRPESTSLMQAMAALLAEPRAAFVQARLDSRNRDHNWLTRAQAIGADSWTAYELAARSWAGVPVTFGGTCGIWRRSAIDAAGGWSGRSIVEDQDLSFRAFAEGWSFVNLTTVSVAGELPETFSVLAAQRARWSAGTAQVLRDLPWRLVRRLTAEQGAVFILGHLANAVFPTVVLGIAIVVAVAWIAGAAAASAVSLSLLAVIVGYVALRTTGAALATHLLGRRLGARFAWDVVYLHLMELALLVGVAKATAIGLVTRRIAFVRTPKVGR